MTEYQRKICELWPQYSANEISQMLGCNADNVWKTAKRFGVKHTDETCARLRKKSNEKLKLAYTSENIKRRVEKQNRIRTMERFRINSGKCQKTSYRMRTMPKRAYHTAYALCVRRGYISTTDPFTLFYDERTNRSIAENLRYNVRKYTEDYYTKKYGLKFIADYQNDTTGISNAV